MQRFRKMVVALTIVCAVSAAVLATIVSARQRGEETGPWTAGRCYRATFLDPAQQQTLRVLENPAGVWVRVQSDPRSPRVPGASVRNRVWLNTATVFSLEEIECSSTPGN